MTRKASPKLSWRKRLSITGLVLFTLYLCFGIWAVPAIMISQIESKGSEALGREVSVERATFNPFSLEAKLYGVAVGPQEGESGNLLEIGKLSANPQLSSVFGTITVKSIEVSDGEVWVAVDSSGTFSFQDILDALAADPASEPAESGEIPAVIVENLLLSKLQFHYRDASLATPYEESVSIETFAGTDIGTVDKSSIDNTDTGESPLHWDFDGLITTASGASLSLSGGAESLSPWRFRVDTELVGFPLQSLQPYVDESVVAKLVGTLGFKFREVVELGDAGPSIQLSGSLGIDAFSFADDEQTFASWQNFRVSGIEVDAAQMTATIAEVAYESPVFEAILLQDRSPRLPAMKGSGGSSDSSSESTPFDFEAKLSSVVVSQGRVKIEDRSIGDAFQTELHDIELKLSDLHAKQAGDYYDASGAVSLAMNILDGNLNLEATLESLKGLAEASLSLQGVQLAALQPYVAEHANAELQAGEFSLDIKAQSQGLAQPELEGSIGLQGLKVKEFGTEKQIVSLANLAVEGIAFRGEELEIEAIKLVEPVIAAWQDEAGINLNRIAKLEAQVEEKAEAIEESSGLKMRLGRFELKSAGAGFVDTTLLSTHNSRVSEFELVVEDITTDPEALANFKFSGVVDGSARLAGSGALNFADPSRYLDLDLSFRGYDLTSTSPYWATYLGRKLSKGQFEIISRYEVRDNQLKGTNDFKIDQLTLGERVQSERAINLPLGFAIKLMQDPNGLISYDGLPVEGDLSDPQVKPWGLVGKAIRNLILKAVASPLKFLAGLAGGREDLDTIGFAVAETELSQDALDKVAALRKLMLDRPGLRLEVSFLANPAESTYLKDQYTLHRLLNPDWQVISGLDLLKPVDESVLESFVRARYGEILAEEAGLGVKDQGGVPTEGEAAPVESLVEASRPESTERKGLVKRLAGLIGLESEGAKTEPTEDTVANRSSVAAEVSQSAEQVQTSELPSLETMLARVLEASPNVVLDENWLEDLAEERIRNFKSALLEGEEIQGSRVFSSEVDEAKAEGALGTIQVRLSE